MTHSGFSETDKLKNKTNKSHLRPALVIKAMPLLRPGLVQAQGTRDEEQERYDDLAFLL